MNEHLQWLEIYRQTQAGVGWHTAPDDGYLYDHLAHHLEEAGRVDELKGLFADQNWMQARVAQAGYEGYLNDLTVAWEIAHQQTLQQIDADREPTAILDCVRYALIQTSLNTVMGQYVPALVERALETGLWTVARVRTIIQHVEDAEARVKLYGALLASGRLDVAEAESIEKIVLKDTAEIESSMSQALVLGDLASDLTDENREEALLNTIEALFTPQFDFPPEFLSMMPSMDAVTGLDLSILSMNLVSLLPSLTPKLIADLRDRMIAFHDAHTKAWILAHLAQYQSLNDGVETLMIALEAAVQIDNELDRANTLAQLAPQVSGEALDRILDSTTAIQKEEWRPRVLSAASLRANEAQQERILALSLAIQHPWHRAYALAGLIHHVAPEKREIILQSLLALDDEEALGRGLSSAGQYLSGDLLQKALIKARAMQQSDYRADVLFGIADQFLSPLREALHAEAEQATGDIEDPQQRSWRMEELADDEDEASDVRREQLQAIGQIRSEEDRARELISVIPHLPEDLLEDALTIVLSMDKVNERVSYEWSMSTLAPRLEGDLLSRALADAANIADGSDRVSLLVVLMSVVDKARQNDIMRYAFDSALSIPADWVRASAIRDVVPILDDDHLAQALTHALEILPHLPHNEVPVRMLDAFAKRLDGEQKSQTVDRLRVLIREILDESARLQKFWAENDLGPSPISESDVALKSAQFSAILAAHVEPVEREKLLNEAMAFTETLETPLALILALREIVPLADEEMLKLVLILSAREPYVYAEIVLQTLDQLSTEQHREALSLLPTLEHGSQRVQLMIALLPHLTHEQRVEVIKQAVQEVLTLDHPASTALYCLKLLPFLEGDEHERVLTHGLTMARQMDALYGPSLLYDYSVLANTPLSLRREAYHNLLETLAITRENKPRDAVFTWCYSAIEDGLPDSFIGLLSDHILTICRDWRW